MTVHFWILGHPQVAIGVLNSRLNCMWHTQHFIQSVHLASVWRLHMLCRKPLVTQRHTRIINWTTIARFHMTSREERVIFQCQRIVSILFYIGFYNSQRAIVHNFIFTAILYWSHLNVWPPYESHYAKISRDWNLAIDELQQ